MKKYIFISLLLTLLTLYNLSIAQEIPLNKKWLHIYAPEGVTEFHAIPYDSIADFTFVNNVALVPDSCERDSVPVDDILESDGFNEMRINYKNGKDTLSLPIENIDHFDISRDLPVIDINLDDYPEVEELWNKELYLNATVNIDGAGEFEDIMGWETKIKGRGNTTWGFPKKPYRFKASKKISLLGMKKAKSYALIANYLDGSHMKNFVALTIARELGMPFTNSCVPVRLHFNGIDKGLYFLTEKIGISGASVDINEKEGWLLELDVAMDEENTYRSNPFNLPVMLKDPDLSEISENPQMKWNIIKNDFDSVMNILNTCRDDKWHDVIDSESLMDYLIVYSFVLNVEIRHPKSFYLYKKNPEDKYHFGPVWDFDWSCGYTDAGDYTHPYTSYVIDEWNYDGSKFLRKLTRLPGFLDEYRTRWDEAAASIYPKILSKIDEYAKKIRPAAKSDGVIWSDKSPLKAQSSFDFDLRYAELIDWLEKRIQACAKDRNRLLIR